MDVQLYLFAFLHLFALLCLGTHFWLAIDERNGPVSRFLLLGGGGIASLAFSVPVVVGLPLNPTYLPIITFLMPGAWLIFPACVGFGINLVFKLPVSLTSAVVTLAWLGTATQLGWWLFLFLSE